MSLILLQIVSLVYIMLFNIFYFSRSHISTLENKIYKYLLVLNAVGLTIELCCFYSVAHMDTIPLFNAIITKLLLVYYILFISIYTIYVFVISYKDDENDKTKLAKNYKKTKLCCLLAFAFFSTIISVLPLEYYNDGKYVYSYGTAVDFLSIILVLAMTIWVIIIVRKFKNIKTHKYLPVIVFVVLAGIGGTISRIYPHILLTTPIETFIIFLMYFTIENPDVKMLDEMHRAKEISDNANEEKTIFLYNMTNEIRDITKNININATNILEETSNKKINVESINDSARNIQESTAIFTTITNEILDVSSIDSASIKIYNDKYNINLIIKELMQAYSAKCKKKGLEFRGNIQSDLPNYLYGDSVGLKSALTTILDNSVKYTDEGYVEFNVSFIKKNEVIRLVISVEDSGIGIRADELNKVFVDKSSEEERDKLNLSSKLINAKKLITLMGGTLIPKSSFGSGTSMKIILDQKIAPEEDNLSKYEKVYDKKKVLLVGTEDTNKEITKLLKESNILLETTTSGKECLDKIRDKENYDLILLEEEITPLDGIKVMEKLAEIRSFNTNVVLLSNNEYEEKEYTKLGFSYVYTKPISENIIDIINKY